MSTRGPWLALRTAGPEATSSGICAARRRIVSPYRGIQNSPCATGMVECNSDTVTRFMIINRMQFYIDGAWVDPVVEKSTPVVNPATEEAMYEVALGSRADVDKAVAAAVT
jgi:hypothetical protein